MLQQLLRRQATVELVEQKKVFLFFLAGAPGMKLRLEIFNVELDSAELDDITPVHLVVEIVLGRLGVANNDEHLVVYVLVCNWVALAV